MFASDHKTILFINYRKPEWRMYPSLRKSSLQELFAGEATMKYLWGDSGTVVEVVC